MTTESVDSRYENLDCLETGQVLDCLLQSQRQAADAVAAVTTELSIAVEAARLRLADSAGRLILVGAGASGRLAVQDGAELWPTYGWPWHRLVLRIAGGDTALLSSMDGAEDDVMDANRQVTELGIATTDVVVGLAASGATPWTCEWLGESRRLGALTIGFANNSPSELLQIAEHGIHLDSGAEVLAGSTRMAAGTAQKISLNLFSTSLMVKLNRTYGNLMVDMAATNSKLNGRRLSMIQHICPQATTENSQLALDTADGNVKLAVLILKGLDRHAAEALLLKTSGSLRQALEYCSADKKS